jgi:indole-3-glycerol phosphate synthase
MEEDQLKEMIQTAEHLGLSALVETHDEEEIEMAVLAGAKILGVNNRNLKDFTVDINNSVRLRRLVPESILFVAESGIRTRQDIEQLEQGGVSGVLIGEQLMRSPDKKKMLEELKGRKSDD